VKKVGDENPSETKFWVELASIVFGIVFEKKQEAKKIFALQFQSLEEACANLKDESLIEEIKDLLSFINSF